MKRSILLLALALIPSVLSAQPSGIPAFTSLRWGMSVSEVSAASGRDALLPFEATVAGRPAVVAFRFDLTGSLVRIDVDLARSSERASLALAESTITDIDAVGVELNALFSAPTNITALRPESSMGTRAGDLLVGRTSLHWLYSDAWTIVDHVADCVTAQIIHRLTFRRHPLSSTVPREDIPTTIMLAAR